MEAFHVFVQQASRVGSVLKEITAAQVLAKTAEHVWVVQIAIPVSASLDTLDKTAKHAREVLKFKMEMCALNKKKLATFFH